MTDEEAADLLAKHGYLVPPGASRDAAAEAHLRATVALRVKGMLVEALVETSLGLRPEGAECWCGADEGLGERHNDQCLRIRAAVAEARKAP